MNKTNMYVGSIIGGIGLAIVWWNSSTFWIPVGIWMMIWGNNLTDMYFSKKYK